MTSMNFLTLPYDHVTNSFLLEICFWGPTYPTFLYNVTLLDLFFFELFPYPETFKRVACCCYLAICRLGNVNLMKEIVSTCGVLRFYINTSQCQ